MQKLKQVIFANKLAFAGLALATLGAFIYLQLDSNKSGPELTGPLDKPTHQNIQPEPEDEEPKPPAADPDAVTYFKELALGADYNQIDKRIHKWAQDSALVSIQREGTDQDRLCIADTISDFNALSSTIQLTLGEHGNLEGMIQVIFAPEPEFADYEQYYEPINHSFTLTYLDENQRHITYAPVLIDTATLDRDSRCVHARSILVKSLGFLNKSDKYPDSIFYTGEGRTATKFSELDKQVIRFMYGSYGITSGDNSNTIDQKLGL